MIKYILLLAVMILPTWAWTQEEEIAKHENLVYYNTYIQEYLVYMRENTNDPEMLVLIEEMEKTAQALQEKLNNVVLPVMDSIPAFVEEDMGVTEDMAETEDETSTDDESQESTEEDFESFGMSKFIPFKSKIKTSFDIQFGINNFYKNAVSANVEDPEVYTPSSWFWEFALLTKNRLGGKNSKVALSYGFSYLINRFSMDNDVRLAIEQNQPVFLVLEGAKKNPKLNIGYVTIPLAFDVKLSKGFQFSLGGFAGYRVHTVQKLESKPGYEKIKEERYSNYRLNNWMYGAKVSIGLKGFNLVGKYCFSNLFRENDHYDFNTFMIGTSIRM